MVDFNSNEIMSSPVEEVVRMIILEARNNLFDAIEAYTRLHADGAEASPATMKSRLWRLYMETAPLLKRHMKKEEYESLKEFCDDLNNTDAERIRFFTRTINHTLDTFDLIKIDNKRPLGTRLNNRDAQRFQHHKRPAEKESI